jgi:FkbM family methyltransferase
MSAVERLWNASRRLGIDSAVAELYWRARLARHRGGYEASVGEALASFEITTKSEYHRATTFLGELSVLEAFVTDLEQAATVWDVGACVGTYACFAASVATDGHVVAVEPEPTNRERLTANLTANASGDRWEVRPVALTDRDGPTRLERGPVHAGSGHHFLSSNGTGIPVPGRRGETLVDAGAPSPDVLKIDVQGAELDVLRGMGRVLDDVERIYAELHVEKCSRYGTTVEKVESFLADAGFDVTHFGAPEYNRSGVYHVTAHRP